MEQSPNNSYGPHLLMDCYGANQELLRDPGVIFDFLDRLPEQIGMQKIGPPQIARFENSPIEGISGIVMITTSHISIHTYSIPGIFFFDAFSCRPFNVDELIKLVIAKFQVGRYEKTLLMRGKFFSLEEA